MFCLFVFRVMQKTKILLIKDKERDFHVLNEISKFYYDISFFFFSRISFEI